MYRTTVSYREVKTNYEAVCGLPYYYYYFFNFYITSPMCRLLESAGERL